MYKRFSIEDLTKIESNFLGNLVDILKYERFNSLKEMLKSSFQQGNEVYFFVRGTPLFKIEKNENGYKLIDEKERIELIISDDQQPKLNSMVKNFIIKKNKNSSAKSIEKILMDEFVRGVFDEVLGRPYIVYDIETSSNVNNIKELEFYIGYYAQPDPVNKKMKYNYVDKKGLEKFVNMMLNMNGYIIGFNNIAFDNPVCIYNLGLTEKELEIINSKSIDLFLFVWGLTNKRLSLNKVSNALIGIEKTLESGVEGSNIYEEYLKTNDTKLLDKFKKYCKNDVRMTTMVLLYFLHFKKIYFDGENINFEIEDMIKLTREKCSIKDQNGYKNCKIL